MEARVVRFADLKPCYDAFVDCRTPGSEAKENFTIVGPGVSENPAQHVHIAIPHGFNIGGARQPPGCVNSQHSHETAEVFVVHSGHWRFDLGEHGDDARVELAPGDVISLPTRMFRGFTNTGDAPGFLWAVLGGDDPGRVTWAPQVFDMARDYGLRLLDDGSLIDLSAGDPLPEGARPMARTSAAQVAAMRVSTLHEAETFVARDGPAGLLETPIIGALGPLARQPGFTMNRIDLFHGSIEPAIAPGTPTVLFLHRGALRFLWNGGALDLGEGDTITVPLGLEHTLEALQAVRAFVVRGV